MPEILPAYFPEIPDGSAFIRQEDADVVALVTAAGDRVAEIIARPGYGYIVPKDIAKSAKAKPVDTVNSEDVAPEPGPDVTALPTVPDPASDPAPASEPAPETSPVPAPEPAADPAAVSQ